MYLIKRLYLIRMAMGILFTIMIATSAIIAQNTIPCNADPEFKKLDFLVGNWIIKDRSQNKVIAKSSVHKISKGCALMEERVDVEGFVANSLIYFNLDEYAWKQVWISESPRSRGGVKEKVMDDFAPVNSVRFSGSYISKKGKHVLERMTFTRLPNSSFIQKIETSENGGMNWELTFEGIYFPDTSPAVTVADRFRRNQ